MGNKEIYESLPKKRMAAGVLFAHEDRILILRPSYGTYWVLPGGVVGEGETPRQAAERELYEELGLRVRLEALCAIDHVAATDEKSESLQFVFLGPRLSAAELAGLRVQSNEVVSFEWLVLEEAYSRLNPKMAARLKAMNAANFGFCYLENGTHPG